MKKKELLKLLDKCSFPNEACKTYFMQIKYILYSFPDEERIDLAILDEFKRRGEYVPTRMSNRDFEGELKALFESIRVWVDIRMAQKGKAHARMKKSAAGFKIFMTVIVLMVACTIVVTILDLLGKFRYGDQLSITFDSIGLITGLIFFAYERITDRSEKSDGTATAEQIQKVSGEHKLPTAIHAGCDLNIGELDCTSGTASHNALKLDADQDVNIKLVKL